MKIELTLEELYYASEADYNFKEFFKENFKKLEKCNNYAMLSKKDSPVKEITIELKFNLVTPKVYINTKDNLYVDDWPS